MNVQCSKNFDFLKEKNILLITEDEFVKNYIQENLLDIFSNIEYKKNSLSIESFSHYDLIVVDITCDNLTGILFDISSKAKDIPVIFITDEIDNSVLSYSKNIKLRNIVLKELNMDFLKYYITIILDKTNLIYFNNGFYFDLTSEKLFNKGRNIKLTTLETNLLKYLINHKNKIVSYDDIKNYVWKNNKFSIFGMRNVVKKIRDKSYYDIIDNLSKNGYTLKNYHIFS